MAAKPFLKWAGGKTQILDAVLDRFPSSFQDYHEPFLGGGSVLIGLLERIREGGITVNGTLYASDINSTLIQLYQYIQDDVEGLIRDLKKYETRVSSEDYYALREEFNRTRNPVLFLYLNKTCFRGLYREGPRGFNVPFGHYAHPMLVDEDNLRNLSVLFRNVLFTCQPFETSLALVKDGDFTYLDPPYVPVRATSFVGYTADGFSGAHHKALFDRLKASTYSFLLSNADVPLVIEQFPSATYRVEHIVVRRAIHSLTPDAKAVEVLIKKKE